MLCFGFDVCLGFKIFLLFPFIFIYFFNPKLTSFGCNCREKGNCPLDGECSKPNIIYVQISLYITTIIFIMIHQKQLLNNITAIILVTLKMANANILLHLLNTSASLETSSIIVLSGRFPQ